MSKHSRSGGDAADVQEEILAEFQRDLSSLINRHSLEQIVHLPADVLAAYLTQCLVAMKIKPGDIAVGRELAKPPTP